MRLTVDIDDALLERIYATGVKPSETIETGLEHMVGQIDRLRSALEQIDGNVGRREQAIITQVLRPPTPGDQQGAA